MDKPLPPAKAATVRDLLRELKKRRSFVCATTLAAGTVYDSAQKQTTEEEDGKDNEGEGEGAEEESRTRARQEALRLSRINLLISVIEISFAQGDQY